jgi:hypothetical protein
LTSDRPEDIPKHLQQELLKNVQVQGNLTTGDITQIASQFVLNLDKSPKPTGIAQNLPAVAFITLSDEKKQSQHYTSSCSTAIELQFLRSLVWVEWGKQN